MLQVTQIDIICLCCCARHCLYMDSHIISSWPIIREEMIAIPSDCRTCSELELERDSYYLSNISIGIENVFLIKDGRCPLLSSAESKGKKTSEACHRRPLWRSRNKWIVLGIRSVTSSLSQTDKKEDLFSDRAEKWLGCPPFPRKDCAS
jgi:hypothetical protein